MIILCVVDAIFNFVFTIEMTANCNSLTVASSKRWTTEENTVDVDKVFDIDRAEAVCGVTHVDAGVGDVDTAYAQYAVVDAVPLPAKVDALSVLGPRHDRRRRWRLDRAN